MQAPARITSARAGWRPATHAARPPSAAGTPRSAVHLAESTTVDVDDVRVVVVQAVLDGGEVGRGAPDRDHHVRAWPAPQVGELGRDRAERCVDGLARHGVREPEALGEPYGAHVDAKLLLDPGHPPEGELAAAPAGVEHQQWSPVSGRADTAARYASRASSRPEMTSTTTPQRVWTAATNRPGSMPAGGPRSPPPRCRAGHRVGPRRPGPRSRRPCGSSMPGSAHRPPPGLRRAG